MRVGLERDAMIINPHDPAQHLLLATALTSLALQRGATAAEAPRVVRALHGVVWITGDMESTSRALIDQVDMAITHLRGQQL